MKIVSLRLRRLVLLFCGLLCSLASATALELPAIFGDGMVLQRDKPVAVWGTADAGKPVAVSFAGRTVKTTADSEGRWKLALPPMPASGEARELTVKSGDAAVTFKDVLVGEVWLCSGQSNMEKPLGEQKGQQPVENYREELAAANFPKVRLFQIYKEKPNTTPQRNLANPTGWLPCSGEALEKTRFSAVGYFFARDLFQKLKVPVGIIHSSWGGTRIELWIPPDGFASVPSLKDFAEAARNPGQQFDGSRLGTHYNAMIAPVVPFTLRGVIWYQGESNVVNEDGLLYADKMKALINGWRTAWNDAAMSFYWVGLAPYAYSLRTDAKPHSVESLPLVWEAQARCLQIPNTGMAVTTDLVSNMRDIHPTQKAPVGERLARIALATNYGVAKLEYSGPVFRSMTTKGTAIEIDFDHLDGGLASRDKQPLTAFSIAGEDRQFVEAAAVIKGNKVVVSSPAVPRPVAVRFGWHETAVSNFINKAGLPAMPFRTDDWPIAPALPRAATPTPTPTPAAPAATPAATPQ